MRKVTGQRGFTLVEIMVAVVILAMLIVGLSSVIENSLQSRDYVTARSELTREAEFAMDRMVHMVSHSRRLLLALADKGWRQACEDDPHLLNGLNVHAGKLTYYAVGKALGIDVLSPGLALKH